MGFAKKLRKGWGSIKKQVIKPIIREAAPVLSAGRDLAANTLRNTSKIQAAGVKAASGVADTISQPFFLYAAAGVAVLVLLNKKP